jgi:hypothetical protein
MAHPLSGARYQEVTVDGLTVRLRRCTSATLLETGKPGMGILLALMPRSQEDLIELAAIEGTTDPALKQQRSLQLLAAKIREAQRPENLQARQERAEQLVQAGLVAIQTEAEGWLDCCFVPGPAPDDLPDTTPIPLYAELLPRGNETVLALAEAVLKASGGVDLQKIERFRLRPSRPTGGNGSPREGKVDLGGAGADARAARSGAGGAPISDGAEGTAGKSGRDSRD